MSNTIKTLCIGDIVGPTGCKVAGKYIQRLEDKYKANVVIINGENSAHKGRGITGKIADELFSYGANVITTGNHIWAEKDIISYIQNRFIRLILIPFQ